MKPIILLLTVLALVTVGGWYFVRHSPACNDWRYEVFLRVQESGSRYTAATYVVVQEELGDSRPWGCPEIEV
jgi:hypothetical protein